MSYVVPWQFVLSLVTSRVLDIVDGCPTVNLAPLAVDAQLTERIALQLAFVLLGEEQARRDNRNRTVVHRRSDELRLVAREISHGPTVSVDPTTNIPRAAANADARHVLIGTMLDAELLAVARCACQAGYRLEDVVVIYGNVELSSVAAELRPLLRLPNGSVGSIRALVSSTSFAASLREADEAGE
jgi:hypothetical protein